MVNFFDIYILPRCIFVSLSLTTCLCDCLIFFCFPNPVGMYLLKVNNKNTRARCKICSKLTIKTPERRHTSCSSVSIVNFEQVFAGWESLFLLPFPFFLICQVLINLYSNPVNWFQYDNTLILNRLMENYCCESCRLKTVNLNKIYSIIFNIFCFCH